MAIAYLHWTGVHVYGTAGQVGKHAIVRSLGVAACFSSRSATSFTFGLTHELTSMRMHGAANSVIDDFIPASIATLAEVRRVLHTPDCDSGI